MDRFENRTHRKNISIRQSGFGDDAWIQLEPLSTTIFTWEDPYGKKSVDTRILSDSSIVVWELDLEGNATCTSDELGLQFHSVDMGDVKVARFTENRMLGSNITAEPRFLVPSGNWGTSQVSNMQKTSPLELIVELGVVGLSVIDHQPKELSYFYLERVSVSYSTGYDGGKTSR